MRQFDPENVEFLAKGWTKIMSMVPQDVTHVLHCDSYYLNQTRSLENLIRQYRRGGLLGHDPFILGGGIWTNEGYYYDTWATPEMDGIKFEDRPKMPVSVKAVGAVLIAPIEAYRKNGFTNEGFPREFFWTNYCKGFETILDPNIIFTRTVGENHLR
jgi:hypothetical protein